MDRFEYKYISILGGVKSTTKALNKLGQEGWELVAVCLTSYYFKRKLAASK